MNILSHLRNENIPSGLYRLYDIDNTDLGIKPIAIIREMCEDRNYDCILVNADVRPGIVRLEEKIDDSKRKYLESKQSRKQKQKEIKTKTYVIDKPLAIQQNDLNRKMNEVINAVRKNYSVTFTFKAMGRYAEENTFKEVEKRFDECYEYIMSHENVSGLGKKISNNTVNAVFRYTTKK